MTAGNEDITTLYVAEGDRLRRQIGRRVGCAATACDLVQDIFLRLWERAPVRKGSDAAYLNRCARNAAIDHLRAEQTRRSFANGVLPEQYAAPPSSPHAVLEARQSVRGIDAALAALQASVGFRLTGLGGRIAVMTP